MNSISGNWTSERISKLADQIYWCSTACCCINTKSLQDVALKHTSEIVAICDTIVAKGSSSQIEICLGFGVKNKTADRQWEGGETYAHPFPLQQNEVGDFFGHESILSIWKQGTSPKYLLLFPEIMLWNEDVPLKTCKLCVEVAPCRPMGQVTGGFPRRGTPQQNSHHFPLRLVLCWLA